MGEWQSPVEIMETWAAKLPARRFGLDGEELLSSRIRRAVAAHGMEFDQEKSPEQQALERAERAARAAEARVQQNRELEARYWEEYPAALERMGLEVQERMVLAALEMRPSVTAARDWWVNSQKHLFLTLGGVPRQGKTIAAVSLMVTAASERVSCESLEGYVWNTALARFVKAQELARMSLYGEETQKRLHRLKLVGLLVVDDLGAEAKSDAWWALLDELVDARARHQVRTVFTTNLTGKQLQERYGPRIFQRLKQFGEFIAVEPIAAPAAGGAQT